MTSPDPNIRDGSAYQELYTRIRVTADLRDAELSYIAERAVAHLTHARVQARTVAPLILTWLIRAQNHCPTEWFSAAADWYLNEPDTRGHDPHLGWLHAIAHGADLIATAVTHGGQPAEAALRILGQRTTATTDYAWQNWIEQTQPPMPQTSVHNVQSTLTALVAALDDATTIHITDAAEVRRECQKILVAMTEWFWQLKP